MSNVNSDFYSRFLKERDHTGRFIVVSQRTGHKYFVEPIDVGNRREWGSVNPGTGEKGALLHKKGDGKYRGAIDEADSMITVENGFDEDKIHYTGVSVSPEAYIDMLDAKYPDRSV